MADVKVEGWLSADPTLKYTQSGMAILELSLPENHRKKQGNEWVNDGTTWWKVKAFGLEAEHWGNAGLLKGARVQVAGRSKTETWTDRDGQDRQTLVILDPAIRIIPAKEQAQPSPRAQDAWAQPTQQQNWGGAPSETEAPF
ncbi:single-stranded DNA-binding protein [Arthrobacter russicus]|uniref:Single-stranded DNA-binding protein n=1 Tax=Arthrobacter russicus TaxID=172040 RepID=A0ABU1JDY3_9MICC|nr:single-stranded DNA-binding protein [Arthrobacter russicus]MDR6270637.1 single-strand DNA-binding protein [Arthrobacter russicus]